MENRYSFLRYVPGKAGTAFSAKSYIIGYFSFEGDTLNSAIKTARSPSFHSDKLLICNFSSAKSSSLKQTVILNDILVKNANNLFASRRFQIFKLPSLAVAVSRTQYERLNPPFESNHIPSPFFQKNSSEEDIRVVLFLPCPPARDP